MSSLSERPGENAFPDLASELFHRVNRVLPEDQALVTIAPEATAREAILASDHGLL